MENILTKVLPQEGGLEGSRSGVYNGVIGLLGLLTLVGIAFGLHAFYLGYHNVYGVSREVPWGVVLAAYVFFVVTSTGLCLVSSIGHVFGFETFKPIAKRSVFLAIATIVSGFLVIAFEIENPWRMAIYNIISPNLTSSIWWMGTLYGAYLFFMLIEFALLQAGKHKIAGVLGVARRHFGCCRSFQFRRCFWTAQRSRILAWPLYAHLFHRIGDDVWMRHGHSLPLAWL